MWLTLAFVSAALLGLYDICKKHSLRGNAVIPILFLNTLFCSILLLPCAFQTPFGGWGIQRYILLKAGIVLSSWLLGYIGMKHLPITIVGPINATRPILVLLGALLFFSEKLNLWQWAGVLLAITSFILLSKSGKKEGIDFKHNRWIFCIAGATVLGAISGLYDKYLMTCEGGLGIPRLTVQCWYNFYQMAIMGVILLVLWWPKRKKSTPFQWRWSILLISVFLSLADFVYFSSLSLDGALISVVSMVRRSCVLVSFSIGALFFHEKNLRSKAIDLMLVLLSMVLLWLGQ